MVLRISLIVVLPFLLAAAPQKRTPVIDLPRGPLTRIASPDKSWTLVFECPNECAERKLWIEKTQPKQRRLVSEYERSLGVSWAPDSRHFFVYDEAGSNEGFSYIYDAATLDKLNLAELVTAHDKAAVPFLKAGHSYMRAKYWIDAHALIAILTGHFDESPSHSFTLKYRIGIDGNIRRLSLSRSEQP